MTLVTVLLDNVEKIVNKFLDDTWKKKRTRSSTNSKKNTDLATLCHRHKNVLRRIEQWIQQSRLRKYGLLVNYFTKERLTKIKLHCSHSPDQGMELPTLNAFPARPCIAS